MNDIAIDTKVKEVIDFLDLNLKLPVKFKKVTMDNVYYLISNYYDSIDMIVLFGSCSRGKPGLTSDIDILILSYQAISRQMKADIRAELCETAENVSSDVIFYTFESFKCSTKRIVEEIKRMVLFCGRRTKFILFSGCG